MRSWCTFNEPGVYTFSGYCMGGFPPAKAMHLHTAGRVLKHMLIAHTDAYRLIKGMPGVGPYTHVVSTLWLKHVAAHCGPRAEAHADRTHRRLPPHQGHARCEAVVLVMSTAWSSKVSGTR